MKEKHQGQYSCHPILEWNSAELFLYIYTNKLMINEAYKKEIQEQVVWSALILLENMNTLNDILILKS